MPALPGTSLRVCQHYGHRTGKMTLDSYFALGKEEKDLFSATVYDPQFFHLMIVSTSSYLQPHLLLVGG